MEASINNVGRLLDKISDGAMDIGLIGPGLEGSEHKVSICAKDASIPYDYELTNRLIRLAEENGKPEEEI